jgi:hypothetical protein
MRTSLRGTVNRLAAGALLVALAACATLEPPPSAPDPDDGDEVETPTTGALAVSVTGLPEGVAAAATLHGPDGSARTLTGSVTLQDLDPGAYALVALPVCRDGGSPAACAAIDRFWPDPADAELEIVAGETSEAQLTYACELANVPDPQLESALLAAVREATGDEGAALSCTALAGLVTFSTSDPDIADLEGLQHAHNLESLLLAINLVDDITPLAELTKLRDLVFVTAFLGALSPLSDVSPLDGLTRLEHLVLGPANVTELPDMTGWTGLVELSVIRNPLEDLSPVATVSTLERLTVTFCAPMFAPPRSPLADLTPLAPLTALTSLRLDCHEIEDLSPLASLPALTELGLRRNRVRDLSPLANHAALERIDVTDNPLPGPLAPGLDVVTSWPSLREFIATQTFVNDLRPFHLHASRFDTLERVVVGESCTDVGRVPNAGYRDRLEARGVEVQASYSHVNCRFREGPVAVSTFEVDDEGWTTTADATGLRRVESGGLSDGPYLEADAAQTGLTWFWEAPGTFLGDASAFIDREIEIWLRHSETAEQEHQWDVILEGAGLILRASHGVDVGVDWTRAAVTLGSPTVWWLLSDEPATPEVLFQVLLDLERLWIRGEYWTGAGTGGLAFVAMGGAPQP